MSWWCTEKKCMEEYKAFKKLCEVGDNESDSYVDKDDADDILHCEGANCHQIFLRDHGSGEICDYCGANYCQGCASDEKCAILDGTDFVCSVCLIQETNNGNIDYCQNKKKDCKNFVYIKGSVNFQCSGCNIILCIDCDINLLYKGRCLPCRTKKKKNSVNSTQ